MSDADLKEKEEIAQDGFGDFSDASQDETEAVGNLYKDVPEKQKKRIFSRRQKGVMGGVAGLVAGGGIVMFIIMAPILRLEGYMSQINQRVFSYASGAVEARAQHLLERYMVAHVLSLEKCGNHITNDCRVSPGGGVAAGLYANWRDAKIEEKLFDRYGITVETHKNPDISKGQHRVTLRDRRGHLVNLSEGDLQAGRFTGGDREFGKEMRAFLKQETKWYEVMQRRGVRKYLERKHGINSWCFLACSQRDDVDLKVLSAKTRLKYKLIERVVYPFSARYGIIMSCITAGGTGSGCSPERIRDTDIDRHRLTREEGENLIQHFNNNPNQKLSEYIIKQLITRIFDEQVANKAVDAIPVAGQIWMVITLADTVDRLDTFVSSNGFSHYAAAINSAQYLEYYTAMRSSTDELKSGKLPLDDVGALMEEFDGAEQSRVYQATQKTQLSLSPFSTQTAYAAGAQDDYTCLNGKPIPDSDMVCEEKKVARTYLIQDIRSNDIVQAAHDVLDNYNRCTGVEVNGTCAGIRPKTVLRPVIDAVNAASNFILGPIVGTLMDVAQHTPGVGSVISFIQSKVEQFTNWLLGKVFPLPIQADSPGREKYDGLVAGGEVVAMNYGKGVTAADGSTYGLSGEKLTPQQASAIDADQAEQLAYERSQSSLFDRMTNLDDPSSFASMAVMKSPTGFASFFTGLWNIFGIFGTIFSKPAVAASGSTPDSPFGIPRYGYPLDDSDFNADPSKYTDGYCQVTKELHEASKTTDPLTGFDEYSVTDPCMLEKAAVDSAGAYFSNE